MTDIHATSYAPHPAHNLISWSAILAGAAVAIAVGAMLNLLGVALGAASLNPFDLSRGEAEGFSALAGIWVALSNLIGLFVGGFVASRAAKYTDHHRGLLLGLAVWAVSFLAAILIVGASTAGGVASVLNGASEAAADRAEFADLPPLGTDADLAADPRLAGSDAGPAVPPIAQREVEAAADSTATVALWAFLTMLLGAVGAVLGSRYGLNRHRWETSAHVAEAGAHAEPGSRFEGAHTPRPTTSL